MIIRYPTPENLLNTIEHDALDLPLSEFIAYKHFLKYFADTEGDLTLHHCVIGASVVYSWMPTQLKRIDEASITKSLPFLNKAKKGGDLTKEEIETVRLCVNGGSMVGASKLLHCICPAKYPIWDSNVYWGIHRQKPSDTAMKSVAQYMDYMKHSREMSEMKETGKLVEHFGKQVEPLRAYELAIYLTGKKMMEENRAMEKSQKN